MDLKEWKLKQEGKYIPQQFDDDQEEEEEEALSLCDLALSHNVSDLDDSFKENQSSSFDHDLFEFFSHDLSSTYPKDNIIFCGKLIPYKGDGNRQANKSETTKRTWAFPWKSHTFNISRSKSTKIQGEKTYRSCKTFPEFSTEKYEIPAKRVPRWYLLPFKAGRYPAEMELKDIKTRQNKLSDGKMRRSMKSPAREILSEKTERSNWWGLLRILGCQSSHANAMVKASLGLMPNVS